MKVFELWIHCFEGKRRSTLIASALFVTACVATLDFIVGDNLSFALLYLAPVSFVSWYCGRYIGLLFSIGCALTWMFLNVRPTTVLLLWDGSTTLGFYMVVSGLVAYVKKLLDHERTLSRTDNLTGVCNSRAFEEKVTYEALHCIRSGAPFTLVYVDIDDFKGVNDTKGHSVGDELLRVAADTIQANIRRTDILARLGGDEFALLLPDTDQEQSRALLTKLQKRLLERMKEGEWPVSFSMGALTCKTPPGSFDEMVTLADELMYQVKKTSKNSVRYGYYPLPETEGASARRRLDPENDVGPAAGYFG